MSADHTEQDKSSELTPTPIELWPSEVKPITITLPSGAVARVKRPSMALMVRTGRVPAFIRKLVTSKTDIGELTGKDLSLLLDFLVASAFVEPKVSLQPKDGTLHISRICDEDKDAVIELLDLKV